MPLLPFVLLLTLLRNAGELGRGCVARSISSCLPEHRSMWSLIKPLLMLFYLTLLLDNIEKPLLIFKAVFQLILCQSQSLLQD